MDRQLLRGNWIFDRSSVRGHQNYAWQSWSKSWRCARWFRHQLCHRSRLERSHYEVSNVNTILNLESLLFAYTGPSVQTKKQRNGRNQKKMCWCTTTYQAPKTQCLGVSAELKMWLKSKCDAKCVYRDIHIAGHKTCIGCAVTTCTMAFNI